MADNYENLSLDKRQRVAVELRLGGVDYADILKKLPSYNNELEIQKDIDDYIKVYGAEIESKKESLRILEIARLDRLRKSIWKLAQDGDLRAISQCLNISEKYCKLVGISGDSVQVEEAEVTESVSSSDYDNYLELLRLQEEAQRHVIRGYLEE